MSPYPKPDLKKVLLLTVGIASVTVILFFVSLYLYGLVPSFRSWRAHKAASAALIAEAKRLALTYDSILADPKAAMGKPAVWCLKRTSPYQAFLEDNGRKLVRIANPHAMYSTSGSTHQGCIDTLVTISGITATEIAGARNVTLEVSFVDYP